ncbi:Zinc finger, FYVE-type [Niveomyces insectorum RCEF 264]|uniref:Zinc finger, FYVE-type n=1 Tax=Niveomyces insectorum RCEF 264 TaxID=1081102 RepID=A0A167XML3_9HYPO|nr:Zinc finger, FYVE-type [Niveomyces insectorum RCEF 264]
MSARKLGGGRVLGSGKGLAPPDAGLTPKSARSSSPAAASETSTPSRGSYYAAEQSSPSTSSPLFDAAAQDLTASVSLGAPSLRTGSQLFCPICEEEMELPELQQDEVKTWFDKQVSKAKKFQPLTLINQKLRGLDTFESNEFASLHAPSQNVVTSYNSGSPRPPAEVAIDPDELFTRKHWQRSTGYDVCTDPTCAKGLGPLNGSINCRKCGKLFCEAHTMYQMKLSRAASHDPVRGYWGRVCETCYKSRPGYNDHHGTDVELTGAFLAIRSKRVERQNLEIARLEKRLTKLTQLLADPPPEVVAALGGSKNGGASGLLSPVPLPGQRNVRKAMEQSVVAWEEDASVARCPFCQQEFGTWTFRRHHCRICGRVVCADPQTDCSSEVGLSVAVRTETTAPAVKTQTSGAMVAGLEKTTYPSLTAAAGPDYRNEGNKNGQVDVDVRMCRDCRTTLFAKRDFDAAMAHKPADQRAYENLRQFEWGIRQMMPLFQRALQSLQPDGTKPDKPPPTHAQIQEAAKIRRRLMDSFTKYNLAAVRLRDLSTDSPTQKRLQKAVYTAASTFLHANMVPLKHVPRMLRAQQSGGAANHRRLLANLNGGGGGGSGSSTHLSPLRNGESIVGDGGGGDAASVAGSEVSTAASILESEEKELREKLVVLEEQRFLVQQMVDNARGSRRFEEVGALSRNVEELDKEIERLRLQVSGVEERWEGLYAAGAP